MQIKNIETILCFLFLLGDIIVNHNVSVTQNIFFLPCKNVPEKDRALKITERFTPRKIEFRILIRPQDWNKAHL